MPEGIDVYQKYQQVTDWWLVRGSGVEFAYVKLSDGTNTRDDGGYVAGGRAAGVKMGGYHYAQPGDPIAQANLLVNRCSATGATELAPALDLEAPFVPGSLAIQFAIAFLKQVKARGHRPCLYGNNSMLLGVLPAVRAAVPDVIVWCARYGATPTVGYDVHQYSSAGVVPGVTGVVDRNRGTTPLNLPAGGGSTTPAAPTETSEDDLMERITVGSSPTDTSVRVKLSGGPNAGIVIRPALDAAGAAPDLVYVPHVFAWKGSSTGNKTGIGYDPGSGGDVTFVRTPTRFPLPGATWADVEYSSNKPFEIDCF